MMGCKGRMGNGLVAAKTALERAKVVMNVVKRIVIDLEGLD
jgi:hypothetical protein